MQIFLKRLKECKYLPGNSAQIRK